MKKIWVEIEKCLGCKSCELACAVNRDSVGRTLRTAVQESPMPMARVHVVGKTGGCMPLQCRQCADAPCLKVCPAGALHRDEKTQKIRLDSGKCCGCFMCVTSCPFGVIVPNRAGTAAVKCDGCYGMDGPYCVEACPTGALLYCDEQELEKRLAARAVRCWKENAAASLTGAVVSIECVKGVGEHEEGI